MLFPPIYATLIYLTGDNLWGGFFFVALKVNQAVLRLGEPVHKFKSEEGIKTDPRSGKKSDIQVAFEREQLSCSSPDGATVGLIGLID